MVLGGRKCADQNQSHVKTRRRAEICAALQERGGLEAAVLTAPQSKKVYLSFLSALEPLSLLFVTFRHFHFT